MKSFVNYSKNRILFKILKMSFLVVSIFLLSKCDVKAAEKSIGIQANFQDYWSISHNLKEDMDMLLDIAKGNGIDMLIYTSNITYTSKGYDCSYPSSDDKCNSIGYINIVILENNTNHKFYIQTPDSWGYIYFKSDKTGYYSYKLYVASPSDARKQNTDYQNNLNSVIDVLTNKTYNSTLFNHSTNAFSMGIAYSSTTNSIYGTTYKSYLSTIDTTNTYHYLGRTLKAGDLIPSYQNYVGRYYNNSLSNSLYKGVRITFNNSDEFPLIDEGVDVYFEYNIKLSNEMIIDMLPIPYDSCYRPFTVGVYPKGRTNTNLHDTIANEYSLTTINHYYGCSSLSIYFPFPDYGGAGGYIGNIDLKFWSDKDFIVTPVSRDYSGSGNIDPNDPDYNQNPDNPDNPEEQGPGIGDILDDSPPDLGGLGNTAGWLPAGPVDSILTLPLTMFQNIIKNLGNTCTPINLPLPYVKKDLTIPCFNTIVSSLDGFVNWWNGIGLICSGFILYKYLLKLYKWVDNILSFNDNGVNDWGGD